PMAPSRRSRRGRSATPPAWSTVRPHLTHCSHASPCKGKSQDGACTARGRRLDRATQSDRPWMRTQIARLRCAGALSWGGGNFNVVREVLWKILCKANDFLQQRHGRGDRPKDESGPFHWCRVRRTLTPSAPAASSSPAAPMEASLACSTGHTDGGRT